MMSFYILMMKIPIRFLIVLLLVKFNDHFCRMGLALTMTDKISQIGLFESRYIEMYNTLFICYLNAHKRSSLRIETKVRKKYF